jgi:hypothetical protein
MLREKRAAQNVDDFRRLDRPRTVVQPPAKWRSSEPFQARDLTATPLPRLT